MNDLGENTGERRILTRISIASASGNNISCILHLSCHLYTFYLCEFGSASYWDMGSMERCTGWRGVGVPVDK